MVLPVVISKVDLKGISTSSSITDDGYTYVCECQIGALETSEEDSVQIVEQVVGFHLSILVAVTSI